MGFADQTRARLLRVTQRQREMLLGRVRNSIVRSLRAEQQKIASSTTAVFVESVEKHITGFAEHYKEWAAGEKGSVREGEEELLMRMKRDHQHALRQLTSHVKQRLHAQKAQETEEMDSARDEIVQQMNSQLDLMQEDFVEQSGEVGDRVGSLHAVIQSFRMRAEIAEQALRGSDVELKDAVERTKAANEASKLEIAGLEKQLQATRSAQLAAKKAIHDCGLDDDATAETIRGIEEQTKLAWRAGSGRSAASKKRQSERDLDEIKTLKERTMKLSNTDPMEAVVPADMAESAVGVAPTLPRPSPPIGHQSQSKDTPALVHVQVRVPPVTVTTSALVIDEAAAVTPASGTPNNVDSAHQPSRDLQAILLVPLPPPRASAAVAEGQANAVSMNLDRTSERAGDPSEESPSVTAHSSGESPCHPAQSTSARSRGRGSVHSLLPGLGDWGSESGLQQALLSRKFADRSPRHPFGVTPAATSTHLSPKLSMPLPLSNPKSSAILFSGRALHSDSAPRRATTVAPMIMSQAAGGGASLLPAQHNNGTTVEALLRHRLNKPKNPWSIIAHLERSPSCDAEVPQLPAEPMSVKIGSARAARNGTLYPGRSERHYRR